jgi:hypothetical protein
VEGDALVNPAPNVPTLSRRDVKAELEALHAERHRALHTALLGQADPDLLHNREVEAAVLGATRKFRVAEADCELALREALSAAGDDALALLITYPCERLPHDIAARVAGGDVRTINRSRRLASLFQAQRVAPEVLAQGPLVAALLDGSGYPPVTGTTLDAHTAWLALLGRLGVRGEALSSELGVLEFAARNAEGPILASHLARFEGLRPALIGWLRDGLGPVAAIAFNGWLQDEGRRVAALTVLLEACAQAIPENGYLRARLKGILEGVTSSLGDAVGNGPLLARWAGLAAPLLLRLERFGEGNSLLDEAARLLPDSELTGLLSRSRNLPAGWEGARSELATALAAVAETPGREAALAAKAAFDRLRAHRFAEREAEREEVERCRAAVRLATWLAWRADSAAPLVPEGAGDHEVVTRLASWYVDEGAYVDAARRASRGGGGDALVEAVKRVVAASDAARDGEDQRFARALPGWERRPGNAIPIEAALDRLAVPYLEKSPSRRMLVVLLDGMSWAVALELLADLETFETGPIRGQPWLNARSLYPVVAALPTLTEVSRAAFFAGKRPKAGEALSTAADRDRFANHKGLGAFGVPRLLLAADAVEPGGGLTKAARELIAGDERVVGLVVNAVDDQLRGGPQLRPHYRVDDIRPMRDIVREARQGGRAILLAADHGHVPGTRLQYLAASGDGGGARWRPLAAGEEPGPKEIAVGGEAAWRRRGLDRVALLWAEDACYSAGAREGEHGGAALAEVIAPAVLVAATDLARTVEAEGGSGVELEVRPLPRPKWWDLEAPPAPVQAAPAAPAPGKTKGLPTAQATLPFAAPAIPVPAARVAAPSAVDRFAWLSRSKVLDEMLATHPRVKKDLVLVAVRTLAEQEGRMSPEVFANRIGELPRRIGGVVSHLQEVLNLEGYPVLKLDRGPGGLLELDLRRLEELFKEER